MISWSCAFGDEYLLMLAIGGSEPQREVAESLLEPTVLHLVGGERRIAILH